MKKGIFRGLIAHLFLICLCLGLSQAEAVMKTARHSKGKTAEFKAGEIVVKFKKELSPTAISMSSALGSSFKFKIQNFVPLKLDTRFAKIKLADKKQFAEALAALNAHPDIAYAEPNYIYRAMDVTPNDPDFTKQWGMKNTGQKDPGDPLSTDLAPKDGKPGADIHVSELWNRGIKGSNKIVVAVIDTGVNWTHPDLKDQIYTNVGEEGKDPTKDNDGNGLAGDIHGWNFITDSLDSNDDHGHGSHCAGVIGGRADNGIGVAGVNWDVSIMPLKFLDAEGSGSLDAALGAIKYATKMKVNVMNNSWGGGPFSQALLDAITEAKDAGILFAAAAGNNGSSNDEDSTYPASYEVDNVLVVAASDNQDKLAYFSNFGKKSVHVSAPGVNVYSSVLLKDYESMSGTSMATPHVAGIAALLMSANATWDYKEIKRRIILSSDPVPELRTVSISHGRVNATNAFDGVFPPSQDPDPTKWTDFSFTAENKHPYKNNDNFTYKVSIPGAKYIRVHFEKIDVEQGFDYVTVENKAGEVIEKYTGKLTDVFSDYVMGENLVVRLKADNYMPAWGIKVDKIQVIY